MLFLKAFDEVVKGVIVIVLLLLVEVSTLFHEIYNLDHFDLSFEKEFQFLDYSCFVDLWVLFKESCHDLVDRVSFADLLMYLFDI